MKQWFIFFATMIHFYETMVHLLIHFFSLVLCSNVCLGARSFRGIGVHVVAGVESG